MPIWLNGSEQAAVATTFDALTDTPAVKTGLAGQAPKINDAETALEYFLLEAGQTPVDSTDLTTDLNQAIIVAETGGSFSFRRLDFYNRYLSEIWKLNEVSGTRTGSRNLVTLTDVNTVGSATGKDGNAADFDGVNERLDGPSTNPLFDPGTGNFAVSFWFSTDVSGTQIFIEKQDSAAIQGIQIRRNVNALQAQFFSGGGFIGQIFGGTIVNGTLHHGVIIRDGGTAYLFFDGVAGTTLAVAGDLDTTTALTFGSGTGGASHLDGRIDEVYWWNGITFGTTARRNAFVANLFNTGTGRFWITTGTSWQLTPATLFQIGKTGARVPLFSPTLASTTSGNQDLFRMEDGSTSDAFFELTLPRELIDSTNDVTATFWLHTTNTGVAGDVRMEAAIQSLSPADLATEAAVETVLQTVPITNTLDTVHRFTMTFTRANLVKDDKIVVRISRLGGDAADTFTGDIGISKEARWRMSA